MATPPEFFDLMPELARPLHTPGLREAYAGRARTALKPGYGAAWPGQGRIGLNAGGSDKARCAGLGADIDGGARVSVSRRDAVKPEFQEFAPFVARARIVPILADMIPSTSFGASLKNLLTDDCWKAVRKAAFRPAGYVCQVCGEADGPVECHEVWKYGEGGGNGWGGQSLANLLCLCRECHEMFHPGLARLRGREQAASERISAVNDWGRREEKEARMYGEAVHRTRSRRHWSLDLSALAEFGTLEISPEWRMEGGLLTFRHGYGTSRTRLSGADCLQNGVAVCAKTPLRPLPVA